jgi:4-hydroxybenzoate polyprenyltransferase
MGTVTRKVTNIKQVVSGLIREIRPWQWYKQSLLLLGIIFSKNLLNPMMWGKVTIAVAAFCAMAGVIYIFNDIVDIEEDRKHPKKRNRPLASGQITIQTAVIFATLLFTAALVFSYSLGSLFLIIVSAYAAQNVIYSMFLKNVVLVDVLVIAIGFVLRAVGGVVAIDVYLSPWLVVCTFLVALLLAIGKRKSEIETAEVPVDTRVTLAEYTEESLDQMLVVVMSTLLISYSLYSFFRADHAMMLTLPFAFFGVFRYHHLVHIAGIGESPLKLLFDRPFVLNFVVWMLLAVAVLYDIPELFLEVVG